jgi:hypothetical protein
MTSNTIEDLLEDRLNERDSESGDEDAGSQARGLHCRGPRLYVEHVIDVIDIIQHQSSVTEL